MDGFSSIVAIVFASILVAVTPVVDRWQANELLSRYDVCIVSQTLEASRWLTPSILVSTCEKSRPGDGVDGAIRKYQSRPQEQLHLDSEGTSRLPNGR